jgi:hypothetical protein
MSTYYDYREVGVMIAHKLMKLDGWKVYGYHADESDSMTDYYSPAYWNGIAEKNGYILCVNVYGAAKPEEIRKYNYTNFSYNKDIKEKITKLEQMTVNRGASEQEEQSAKMMIERLQKKAETEQENNNKYIVIGTIPGHQAHPPKANWHIEKDGVIIAKGNGILKYSNLDNYYSYDSYMGDMKEFKTMSKEKYISNYVKDLMCHQYYSDEEKAKQSAEQHYNNMIETKKLMDQFESFINKLDTTCGCLVGKGSLETYETIKVTEYKKENKAVEIATGNIKEGQCFILKTGFNYGCYKGLVYRIHESVYEGKTYYHAYKLNGKLTKECTGMASQNNSWNTFGDKFNKWIENGSIAWCNIQEVKTPYEVEKVVKKVIKPENEKNNNPTSKTKQPETIGTNDLHYDIKEDIDTRDNSNLFVVKVIENLSHEEYITVSNNMKVIGGYYSKFKHGFIFKEDPTRLLNGEIKQQKEQTEEIKQEEQVTPTPKQPQPEPKKSIDYEIEQSQHTKTKENIWLVKIKSSLSKDDFAEVKRNFATLKGFYSSFNNSFIFKYDPTEKIKQTA